MADALENILVARKRRLAEAKQKISLTELEHMIKDVPPALGFQAAVSPRGRIAIIAEMKRMSPSAGPIVSNYDPAAIAAAYERGGASAISVLTEKDSFGGDIADVKTARAACRLPILRKDFIFDPYQIAEARAFGADAVLLIADMLSVTQLRELVECANHYQVEPLVELFTSDVMSSVLNCGAAVIGINTRNLRTLKMHPENVIQLAGLIPRDRVIVAESGIKTPADMEQLKAVGVSAALIGESLLRQANMEEAVRTLAQAGVAS